MTREEIIKLARSVWGESAILPFDELARFATLVAEQALEQDQFRDATKMMEPPLHAELTCVCGAEWQWRNRTWELTAPQPQREWVGLTEQELLQEGRDAFGIDLAFDGQLVRFARAIEAKLQAKNGGGV